MKIKYLNGKRLYYGFLAGGEAVIRDRDYLNKINVFPVPDADTGSNLASTMRAIAEGARSCSSLNETLNSMADTALFGARGNSGLIFAQFIQGLKQELKNEVRVTTQAFGEKVKSAVQQACQSITAPVEGTMLTVMRDWADSVYRRRNSTQDFAELLGESLQAARRSLKDTPKKLAVLAKAGVVDAGAKGFVDFLEGITEFIHKGKLTKLRPRQKVSSGLEMASAAHTHIQKGDVMKRYCAEVLISGQGMDAGKLKQELAGKGDSLIVAGSPEKLRIHIHTNDAAEVFQVIYRYGTMVQVKADDMLRQVQAVHEPRTRTAVVTDSACDLPGTWKDEHHIHMIPLQIAFGDTIFLDIITISPHQFYSMLKKEKTHPLSSTPGVQSVINILSFLSSHYDSVAAVSISGKLSGMFDVFKKASDAIGNRNIRIIDSRNLTASQGLIVMRLTEALESGENMEEVIRQADEWISKTHILVDVQTLKYMVRGGRVSPFKGWLAKILNLKPIITLDREGRAAGEGKSFSRGSNMKKIMKKMENSARSQPIWRYAVVHADNPGRAKKYADNLTRVLKQPPAFIMPLSPVVGVHNGIGAVGICYMYE